MDAAIVPVIAKPIVEVLGPTAEGLGERIAEFLNLQSESVKQDKRYKEAMMKYAKKDLKLREKAQKAQEEFGKQLLEVLRDSQTKQIDLKLKEIQTIFDQENLASILSRDDARNILVEGQKKHRLLVLSSPPNVSSTCPQLFQSDLLIELPEELKAFLNRHYPLASELCPVEFFGGFFKRPIGDAEVPLFQKILTAVPTTVIYSQMSDSSAYFHIRFWGPQDSKIVPFDLPAWKWRKDGFNLLVKETGDEGEALYQIQEVIIGIHQLLAAFITDWYYLHFNPLYEPQLFQLASGFPEGWVEPYLVQLRELYRLNQAGVYQERGLILTESERYQEAVASFDKALEIQPDWAEIWHNRGLALLELGKRGGDRR
jgi:tetratricopeptide (TPR) repeat protein